MDPNLLAFQQGGIADATRRMGRSVTFPGGKVIYGVRTELQIDPGEVQPGGFKYTRAFQMTIPLPDLTVVVTRGMEVVDDKGVRAKVIRINVNHLRYQIFFGSVNS